MTDLVTKKANDLKCTLANDYMKTFQSIMGENEAKAFLGNVMLCIQKTPKLLEVSRSSLFSAINSIATLRLNLNTDQAYILPYGNEAQLQIGYQGYVELAYRAGVQKMFGEIVREKDDFELRMGTDEGITHKIDPVLNKKERGKIIGCYVIVKINGEKIYKYMNKSDILEFRDNYSTSYKNVKARPYSPWNEKNDPELNMYKKTVFKQMAKMLPKSENIIEALRIDNKESPVHEKVDVIGGDEDLQKAKDILNTNQNTNGK